MGELDPQRQETGIDIYWRGTEVFRFVGNNDLGNGYQQLRFNHLSGVINNWNDLSSLVRRRNFTTGICAAAFRMIFKGGSIIRL
ncbi:MAG: hypothetical protein DMG13_16615 [Acidobacteria bacterium]|nr:MAG: hypothetical protein DMG13_16615 [Acidobacteriota bacterium]